MMATRPGSPGPRSIHPDGFKGTSLSIPERLHESQASFAILLISPLNINA